MKALRYTPEKGEMEIQGAKMSWTMIRSKAESAFGIRGSRIFHLELYKNGTLVGEYDRGWGKKIQAEDEESALCLSYLISRYGKNKPIRRKEKE